MAFGLLTKILAHECIPIGEYYDQLPFNDINEDVLRSQKLIADRLDEYRKMIEPGFRNLPNKESLIERELEEYMADLFEVLSLVSKKIDDI